MARHVVGMTHIEQAIKMVAKLSVEDQTKLVGDEFAKLSVEEQSTTADPNQKRFKNDLIRVQKAYGISGPIHPNREQAAYLESEIFYRNPVQFNQDQYIKALHNAVAHENHDTLESRNFYDTR